MKSLALNPLPYALAIHTASPDLGLALSNFADDRRAQTWALGRDLSTHLHDHLQRFIQPQSWSDLGFMAVAKGPGGFTGTRIGVVTARTLAQQLEIPLFAVSTLAAAAWHALRTAPATDNQDGQSIEVAVQMLAQRGEVHAAIYALHWRLEIEGDRPSLTTDWIKAQLHPVLPDTVMPLAEWQTKLQAHQTPYSLVSLEGGLGRMAISVLELAYLDWQRGDRPSWSTALPLYGQSPV